MAPRKPDPAAGDVLHPGYLLDQHMKISRVSARQLARFLGVSTTTITNVVRMRNAVTADLALGLADAFIPSAYWWLSRQLDWDLHQAQLRREARRKKVTA